MILIFRFHGISFTIKLFLKLTGYLFIMASSAVIWGLIQQFVVLAVCDLGWSTLTLGIIGGDVVFGLLQSLFCRRSSRSEGRDNNLELVGACGRA